MTSKSTSVRPTVSPIRHCVFQSSRQPKLLTTEFETTDGNAIVVGQLGQSEENIHDAILLKAKNMYVKDGRLVVTIDPYQLKKINGSTDGVRTCLNRLKGAEVTFDSSIPGVDIVAESRIIEEIETYDFYEIHPASNLPYKHATKDKDTIEILRVGNTRSLKVITFSRKWTRLLAQDKKVYYDIDAVAKIKKGVSQAITRFVLTQTNSANGGWKLDTILKAVNAPGRIDHRRRDVLSDIDAIKHAGVIVTDALRIYRAQDYHSVFG